MPIPDGYELKEEYLDDDDKDNNINIDKNCDNKSSSNVNKNIWYEIKQNLLPVYTKKDIKIIDKISANFNISLDNKKYLPGYIGLGYEKI